MTLDAIRGMKRSLNKSSLRKYETVWVEVFIAKTPTRTKLEVGRPTSVVRTPTYNYLHSAKKGLTALR